MMRQEIENFMEIKDTGENSLEFSITFPPSFSGFQGHFPGNSILPGVVQLMTVQTALEKKLNSRLTLCEIASAKFKAPVLPGEKMEGSLHYALKESVFEVSCSLSYETEKKSDLKINFQCGETRK